jgi:hypothetical protein
LNNQRTNIFGPQEVQGYIDGIRQKNRQLSVKNDELIGLAEAKAQAERDYNIAVAEKTLRLKSDGQSITLIPSLVKGDSHVADLKMKLDIADGVQKACYGSIKACITAIDSYRSLLSWAREEMHRA